MQKLCAFIKYYPTSCLDNLSKHFLNIIYNYPRNNILRSQNNLILPNLITVLLLILHSMNIKPGSSLPTDQHSRLYRRIRGHSSDHAREYKKYGFQFCSEEFPLLRPFLFFFFFNSSTELLNSLPQLQSKS